MLFSMALKEMGPSRVSRTLLTSPHVSARIVRDKSAQKVHIPCSTGPISSRVSVFIHFRACIPRESLVDEVDDRSSL